MSDVEKLVRDGEGISNSLPSLVSLKESVKKACDWWVRADALKNMENYPFLETLEALVAKGRPLPVKLDPLPNLETQVASARAWRERTARVFLKKNSHLGLLDVLCPRVDLATSSSSGEGKKKRRSTAMSTAGKEEGMIAHPIFCHLTAKELSDPQNFVKAFKEAEKEELEVR